jgi:nitrogen-specific signal transduction histidine kinase
VQALVSGLSRRLEPLDEAARRLTEASADPRLADQATRLLDAVDGLRGVVEPLRVLVAPPTVQVRRLSLNRLLREAATRVDLEAREGGVPLSLDLDPALPEVDLDPRLSLQAFTSLLRAGLRATQGRRGVPLRIGTRQTPQGPQVDIQAAGELPEQGPGLASLDLSAAEQLLRQQGGRLTPRRLPEGAQAWLVELPGPSPRPPAPGWGLGAPS